MNNRSLEHSWKRLMKNVRKDKYLLLLVSPVLLYYFIFHYVPMYGAIIAFMDFSPGQTILSSQWVGFSWFHEFFRSVFFRRLISNTVILSGLSLIFSFPVPIVFALMLNEMRRKTLKRVVQTVSYLPHFISLVVMVGLLSNLSPTDECKPDPCKNGEGAHRLYGHQFGSALIGPAYGRNSNGIPSYIYPDKHRSSSLRSCQN